MSDPINYQALCLELFGTDDAGQLRRIAAGLQQKNPRNAGRKRALTQADIAKMKGMLNKGARIQEVAQHFHISRQSVSRYLNKRPGDGYTMRIDFRRGKQICTIIYVDFAREQIVIQNRTEDLLNRAFGCNEDPSWDDFQDFLLSRCFPPGRGYAKQILRGLGIDGYDALEIVEATGGKTAEDSFHLTFRNYRREGSAYENH